jgi:hypothetical protein
VAPLAATVNPFAGATRFIAADGARGTPISIFDPAGRLVRSGHTDATGAWTWDGRDAEGRVLSSGVYFARADLAGGVHTLRVVKVR